MAREVIIRTWCDPCLVKGEHTEGAELPPLSLHPGRKPRVLAVCDTHRKELYEPLLEMLAEHGQPVPDDVSAPKVGRPRKDDPQVCPRCQHVAPNRAALASHTLSAHNATIAELNGEELPYHCQECERRFAKPQALGAHLSRAHGISAAEQRARAAAAATG